SYPCAVAYRGAVADNCVGTYGRVLPQLHVAADDGGGVDTGGALRLTEEAREQPEEGGVRILHDYPRRRAGGCRAVQQRRCHEYHARGGAAEQRQVLPCGQEAQFTGARAVERGDAIHGGVATPMKLSFN